MKPKYYSISECVDIDTGEIVLKHVYENKYYTISKEKKVELVKKDEYVIKHRKIGRKIGQTELQL